MLLFRLLEPQQASPEARALLEGIQAKHGRLPNMLKALANSPAALKAYLAVHRALEGGRLTVRLREQIALTVAEANGSQYCLAVHSSAARSLGLSKDEISNNRRAQSTEAASHAVLTFVHLLVTQRGHVSPAEVEHLREAGFDDGQIAEIVTTVAINTFTNYFNLTAGTPADYPNVDDLSDTV